LKTKKPPLLLEWVAMSAENRMLLTGPIKTPNTSGNAGPPLVRMGNIQEGDHDLALGAICISFRLIPSRPRLETMSTFSFAQLESIPAAAHAGAGTVARR
jgi:hypothetical protein